MKSYPATLYLITPKIAYTFAVRWRQTGVLNGGSIEDVVDLYNRTLPSQIHMTVSALIEQELYMSAVHFRKTDNARQPVVLLADELTLDSSTSWWGRFKFRLAAILMEPSLTEYTSTLPDFSLSEEYELVAFSPWSRLKEAVRCVFMSNPLFQRFSP